MTLAGLNYELAATVSANFAADRRGDLLDHLGRADEVLRDHVIVDGEAAVGVPSSAKLTKP